MHGTNRNAIVRRLRGPNIWILLLAGFAYACTSPVGQPVATPASQELRIVNAGSQAIVGLKVLFPGDSAEAQATRIDFGDVPAGKASEYRSVPGGVYRYAAYEYSLNGRLVQQPVVDWVGEKPMDGSRFTYRIELDATKPPGGQVQLIEVQVDVP